MKTERCKKRVFALFPLLDWSNHSKNDYFMALFHFPLFFITILISQRFIFLRFFLLDPEAPLLPAAPRAAPGLPDFLHSNIELPELFST